MPDRRRHRGPHPRDEDLLRAENLPALRAAADDLSWLLERGYSPKAALALVGDRHALPLRGRKALQRVAAADSRCRARRARRVGPTDVAGETVLVDGYNVLLTVEAALAGAPILVGRDGTYRDLASLHRHFKRVDETRPALERITSFLAELDPGRVVWYLDRAISNSGRLAGWIREVAAENGRVQEAELVPNPDPILESSPDVVASADSGILDAGPRWLDLARLVVEARVPDAWIVDLGGESEDGRAASGTGAR